MKKIIFIISSLFLIILGIIFGIFLGGKYFSVDKENINNLKKEIENLKKENKKLQDKDVDIVENDIDDEEIQLVTALNTTNLTYELSDDLMDEDVLGLELDTNKDRRGAKLKIEWDKFCEATSSSTCETGDEIYDVSGFKGRIKDEFIGGYGQDSSGTTLYFLMDDNTVEYVPLFNLKKNRDGTSSYEINFSYKKDADGKESIPYFKSLGEIKGVKNVVELELVKVSDKETGWISTIGVLRDGNFYDLGEETN